MLEGLGPAFAGTITGASYRRASSSAELFASATSSLEISAVCAALPQLGASLPSPHAFGLYDMAGNVWEWSSDYFAAQPAHQGCCAPPDPRGVTAEASVVHDQAGAGVPRRVIKGGSHLCAPNYGLRYRPAARQAEDIDTSTQHIGFRCILRAG